VLRTPALPTDRKHLTLLAAIMGSFVAALDSTVVNVALPAIERDLGGGLAGQQWVSNAYLLTLGSLILVGGSLGDVLGERKVFSLGVAGFGVASLLCALAPSIEVLIGARALQGMFGALLTPSALAVIVSAFPPRERGAAIGTWTAWTGIAMIVGPLGGGWLVDHTSWRWIFAINVPFVIVTLVLVAVAVGERKRDASLREVDWAGAALCALGLAGPVFALIRQPELGWGSPGVVAPFVAGIVLLAAFLAWERRAPRAMMPLGLFRRRNFATGNAETFVMYGGLAIFLFFLVLFLQQVAGYTALEAGLVTIPTTMVMFAFSRYAGRLADRFGPRLFMGVGPLIQAAGLLLLTRVGSTFDYWTDMLPAILVFAVGLTATVAPLTATVLADADESNAGIASGINNAIARVAGLLAVAAVGAIVAASFRAHVDRELAGRQLSPAAAGVVAEAKRRTLARADVSRIPPAERQVVDRAVTKASVDAFHVSMSVAAGLLAAGGLLGLIGIRNPMRETHCAECPGGQLAGAPAAAADDERRAVTAP
jgi:EmrB/QacA subfamily drug resistance transporter